MQKGSSLKGLDIRKCTILVPVEIFYDIQYIKYCI